MGILTWSVEELIYQKCLRHFLQFAWLAPPTPTLMPMPTMVMWDMDMVLVWDMPDTDMDIMEFPSDPAPVLTPSPRDLIPTQGLVGYGHYYGHHLGKREADADAYYGHLGYGHHGVYAAYVPFGSSTGLDPITQGLDASTQGLVGYGHYYGHHLGKREADADAYYGHLGYGYGLH